MQNKIQSLFIICLIASMSFLASCSKDDDGPANAPIVGTWSYSNSEVNILIDNQSISQFLIANGEDPAAAAFQETFFKTLIENELDFDGTSFVFNADGTYTVRENGTVQESGTYQLNSNNTKLTFTTSDGPEEVDVLELTNNKMKLSFSESETDDFNEDGTDNTLLFTFTIEFVK
jgi:hypothetical protein